MQLQHLGAVAQGRHPADVAAVAEDRHPVDRHEPSLEGEDPVGDLLGPLEDAGESAGLVDVADQPARGDLGDVEKVRGLVVDHGDPPVEVDREQPLLDAVQQGLPLLDEPGDLARLEAEGLPFDPACEEKGAEDAEQAGDAQVRQEVRQGGREVVQDGRVLPGNGDDAVGLAGADVDDRRHGHRGTGALLLPHPGPAGEAGGRLQVDRALLGQRVGRGDDPAALQRDEDRRRAREGPARLDDGLGLAKERLTAGGRCPPERRASRRTFSATASARRPSVSRNRASDWASETAATPTRTTQTIASCIASMRPARVHLRRRMPRPSQDRHGALTGRLCLPPAGGASTA